MSTHTRTRGALLLPVMAALALALLVSPAASVQAQGPTTFTSPIDATGLTLQIQASVPDRDSGQPINIPVPPALLPADVAQLLSSPLSSQFDDFWNVKPDETTGKTRRQMACDGIRDKLDGMMKQAPSGFAVHDFQCNLATRGSLLVNQVPGRGPHLWLHAAGQLDRGLRHDARHV